MILETVCLCVCVCVCECVCVCVCVFRKKFKIRRIMEYPEREEEVGGRERVECKVGSLGISLGFCK